MADEFPRAEVIGVDLAPIQPRYCNTLYISSEPNYPLPAHPHVRTAGVDNLTRTFVLFSAQNGPIQLHVCNKSTFLPRFVR